jgi:hypothetical protein
VIAEYGGNVPKRSDRVRMSEQPGIFEVVEVNMLLQTADLKSTREKRQVTQNVSWTSLKFQRVAPR